MRVPDRREGDTLGSLGGLPPSLPGCQNLWRYGADLVRKTLTGIVIVTATFLGGPTALAATPVHHSKQPALSIDQRLLRVKDLHGGWLLDRLHPGSSVSASGCLAMQHRPTPPHASVAFVDPTTFDTYGEAVIQLPTVLQAARFLVGKAHTMMACEHFQVKANHQNARGFVESLTMPNVGDQSQAFQVQVTISGAGGPQTLTVHLFRVGRYVAESIEVAEDGNSSNTIQQAFIDTVAAKKLSS